MKYIQNFESKQDEEKKKKLKEEIQLLDDVLKENPNYDTHDFYIFLASDKFEETKHGMYKKILDIENMVKITPDANSLAAMEGLQMRAMFQHDATLYHIWLPKEIENEISGKSSRSIEPWLVDLINQHKRRGSDEHGKQVLKNVKQKTQDMSKFNL